ncbi:hypothetical protein N658DRAFT_422271 [Parathielavia hyrcaniae]|uniref:DUF7905 domain-containing protein n=1 Tax=Parathielavia hyrcaniae TaxID=113614 RepID=A0AAN6Q3X3_9PEZI|nr:hypothetical protein N658DRAFT_422271 [Parathielavia hyrcaniae]
MRRIYNSGADQVLAKPPPKLNVTLHLSWPAPMRGFKDIDPADDDVETLLARIASEHDAKVEAEEQDAAVSVTIMAMNRAKAQEVIAAVRKQFLYRPGEESVWRVQLVVNPPKDGSNCLTAVLKSRKDATGRRITAVTNKNRMPADGVSLTETKTGYKKALIKMLDEVASHLRHNPNGMQMRVHFGMLVLNEWKKDKNEYSLPELDSMVSRAGTRGTTYFSNKLSEVAAKALAARLTRSNTELPEKLRSFLKRDDTDEDGDPKVIYSMALTTKNLIVESKFEKVDTQRLRNGQGVQYSLGPLEVELGEKQDPAAEFITVCPESDYDWALMIRKIAGNKATKASPPFDVPMLQKNFSFTGQRIGEEGFPYFKIPDSFLRLYDIGNVHGKVMLQYSLGLKYTLEIALVYDLGNQKKVPEHATTATVVLHSPDWDYEMFSDASVPRPWNDSFDEHFFKPFDHDRGPGGQAADPLDHFLLWIDWIQKGLDSASQESDETAGQAA